MSNAYNLSALVLLMGLYAPSAHAYIDPGTGALMVQAAIGAAATALVTIKYWWTKVISTFRGMFASR